MLKLYFSPSTSSLATHIALIECGAAFELAPRQQSAVDARMQRLHSAVQNLGESSHVRDGSHGNAARPEFALRPAGGHDLEPEVDKTSRELDNAGLVVNAQQCPHRVSHNPFAANRPARLPEIIPAHEKLTVLRESWSEHR